jgi:transposase InsO family protein
MDAVKLVRSGWSTRKVAAHLGYSQAAIVQWMNRLPRTGDCAPSHQNRTAIRKLFRKNWWMPSLRNGKSTTDAPRSCMRNSGSKALSVSLSSVQRTLKRKGLIKARSPWKRWHSSFPRPIAEKPGDLVQIDTIHIQPRGEETFYIYTGLDLFSRFAYAKVVWHINTQESLKFVQEAEKKAGFTFKTIQSDNGQEFSSWFTENIGVMGIGHRHSRVRQANDDAHVERFNRSIQEESLDHVPKDFKSYQTAIKKYLAYYNGERSHMGIDFLTPLQNIAELITSY